MRLYHLHNTILMLTAVIVAAIAGYYTGMACSWPKHSAMIVQPQSQDPDVACTDPSQLITAIRSDSAHTRERLAELLAWIIRLRQTTGPLSLDELTIIYTVVNLFGEFRYLPAVPVLAAEPFEEKLRFRCTLSDVPDRRPGPADFEKDNPELTALIQIGPPAAPVLVDQYVESWKIPDETRRSHHTAILEYTLGHESLCGAALLYIQKQLLKIAAGYGYREQNELDALQHLKRELLKPFE